VAGRSHPNSHPTCIALVCRSNVRYNMLVQGSRPIPLDASQFELLWLEHIDYEPSAEASYLDLLSSSHSSSRCGHAESSALVIAE
jgi:hypothetical protein